MYDVTTRIHKFLLLFNEMLISANIITNTRVMQWGLNYQLIFKFIPNNR